MQEREREREREREGERERTDIINRVEEVVKTKIENTLIIEIEKKLSLFSSPSLSGWQFEVVK